jgi:ribosomal protein S18 acetylase RimI-like enzyme
MPNDVAIAAAETVDDPTWQALARLLPQLSQSARPDRAMLARVVAHEASTLLLARIDVRIVGALTLVIYPLPTGLRAHIDDVVVDEAGRGHGVGEALVRAAISEAHRQGVRTIDLTSRPSREAAIRLYTRVGFVRRDSHLFRYQPTRSR